MQPASRLESAIIWLGGAIFVGSLVYCVYSYLIRWAAPGPFAPSALAFDALLFTVFALHHSVFARDAFKSRIARLVTPRLVRSVYVWTASALFLAACALWRPVGGDVYGGSGWFLAAGVVVQVTGLWIAARSVRAIDALELAGIRMESVATSLQTTGPYRLVRHPLYLGWMLCAFGTPHMTGDRLAFAVISGVYLVAAVPWEEQSLARHFGEAYRRYMQQVRWRIVPYVY